MPLSAIALALATIAMWSFLAFFGARLSSLPPFLVVGIALCISGIIGTLWIKDWKVPRSTLLVGVLGIFGYHFLYFMAYQYSPPVETSLINYLWPLLIVMLSPVFLRGLRLQKHHVLGAALGLAGTALILTGGRLSLDVTHLPGYLLAAAAALTWACYSLMTKRLPYFPSGAVGAFCLTSGMIALVVYALSGGFTNIPLATITTQDWIAIFLLGAGPMGAAFYTWDAALKRGDPRVIGSMAYLIPLTSTLILVTLAGLHLTWVSVTAMALIVGGAVIGSSDLIFKRS